MSKDKAYKMTADTRRKLEKYYNEDNDKSSKGRTSGTTRGSQATK